MINPIHSHYSFQNSPTVFDEEALTALEMCGRLGHKVNEIIKTVNGYHVPTIIYVSPTGDKTGELDRATIQGKLDAGYAVQLAAGEYYLNGPLIFRPGYMLAGNSQLHTIINAPMGFIDHEAIVSVDHITVRDVRVKCGEGSIGIDISRKAQGVETGGRYAHFMNVYITGADIGFKLGGCWCTNLTHCRIEASTTCVEQHGSCNHIKYDHCMFLGPEEYGPTCGVTIDAQGGAENYGITFDHCEFERHEQAINAYACVALNVNSIYAEGVSTIFQLDSCPGFLCNGGYISYADRVCNTQRSNSAKVFEKCDGAIRNIYVKCAVGKPNTFYLVSTTPEASLDVTGVTCVNAADGECIVNTQHANSIWNGHEHHLATHYSVNGHNELRYTNALFNADAGALFTRAGYDNKPGHAIKIQEFAVIPTANFTATKAATLKLTIFARAVGHADAKATERVTLMEAYINAGETYSLSEIKFTPVVENYRELIASDISSLSMQPSASDFGGNVNFQYKLTTASGEMIL